MKMTMKRRLAALELEARRRRGLVVCCVQINDGPAVRADGAVCTLAHDAKVTIGGPASWG